MRDMLCARGSPERWLRFFFQRSICAALHCSLYVVVLPLTSRVKAPPHFQVIYNFEVGMCPHFRPPPPNSEATPLDTSSVYVSRWKREPE